MFDIKANWNPTPLGFQKLMRFPPFYRLSDNQLLYGLISSDSPSNKIFFSENASNSNSPLTWGITTGHLAAKHDIVETGVHLRTNLSTGHMWVFFYVSTRTKKFGTHLDFEFFRSEPVIDLDAKDFENTGGEKSGGHVPWLLNTDGSIASPGDFIITVDFNYGDSIAKIGMRIWVNTNELGFMQSGFDQFNLLPNRPFSFTGSFEKSKNADGFGYAEIRPMISLAKSIISKKIENPDFFSIHNFQMSKANNEGQIITLAIDFSSLGLDIVPVVKPNQDLTFSYLLVKSRAAELFSSTLKDFSGPYKIGISLNLGD